MLCIWEFVSNFSMLVKTNDNTESKNSLAGARILNLLNNAQPETLLIVPAIILLI
jgi:hypothetical protein